MLRRLAPLALVFAAGCATDYHDDGHGDAYDDHLHEEGGEVDLKAAGLVTVNDVIRGRGCSTAPLRALDEQIATELACLAPNTMKRIDTIPGLSLGGGARTFIQADAADALRKVAGRVGGLTINSAWRSVAQQHVLKSWEGSCGIGVAAAPGNSNHQSGLALDIADWGSGAVRSAMRAEGFSWYCDYRNGGRSSGCNDPVHFDYFSGDDLRPLAVLAFQKLWNRNNPNDRISEDGSWGPQTAARVSRSPLEGFARVATCAAAGNQPAPVPVPEVPACGYYTDVPGDHIGWPAIEATTEQGWFSGCSASPARFCPDAEMSRATAAVVIARGIGLPERAGEGIFTDLPASHWAAPAIEALYREGIIAGCGEGRFCPDDKVTRVQAVVMLARAFDIDPVTPSGVFTDLPAAHWAAPLVEAMKAAGYTNGCTATTFCPDAVVPRWQMAMLLANITRVELPSRCE
ncbi:MAG: S-layer homology domain-containing protein [bacterium]